MAALYEYVEQGPVASYSNDVSRASVVYILQQTENDDGTLEDDHPTSDDIRSQIRDILGHTRTDPGTKGLRRVTPIRHPYHDFFYASEIAQVATIPGDRFRQGFTPSEDDLPRMEEWANYNNYLITVNFTLRPFNVLGDEDVDEPTIRWYDTDGGLNVNKVATEWNRYCDFSTKAREDIASYSLGEMRFRTSDNSAPDGSPYSALPTIWLPNQDVLFKWFEVPWRYVISPNSYLRRYRGRVNQFDWFGEVRGRDFSWPAGSLLYKNYTVEPYVPPWAVEDTFSPFLNAPQKLVNVTFQFIETIRDAEKVPPDDDIKNKNWVAAGHNLQPWFKDRQYHYSTSRAAAEHTPPTDADKQEWVPTYLSFPIELLFSDPDS